jgi:hypothetical protein
MTVLAGFFRPYLVRAVKVLMTPASLAYSAWVAWFNPQQEIGVL